MKAIQKETGIPTKNVENVVVFSQKLETNEWKNKEINIKVSLERSISLLTSLTLF